MQSDPVVIVLTAKLGPVPDDANAVAEKMLYRSSIIEGAGTEQGKRQLLNTWLTLFAVLSAALINLPQP